MITLDGTKHITTISDETSEQVTRWAAALEGYRKEQERLGIPYGKKIHHSMSGRIIRIKLDIEDAGVRICFRCRIFRKNTDFLYSFLWGGLNTVHDGQILSWVLGIKTTVMRCFTMAMRSEKCIIR